jgi:hypothetical protein
MALPGDRHLGRDIMAMGSLSPVPSDRSLTPNSSNRWRAGSPTGTCCI